MYTKKKHFIQNPPFVDLVKIFNEYITSHNEKFNLYFVKIDIKLLFDKKISPHIICELEIKQTKLHLKRFSLNWIENFSGRGYKFSHLSEMCITTISNKKFMSFDIYHRRPRQRIELELNLIFDDNPQLKRNLNIINNFPSKCKFTYRSYLLPFFIIKTSIVP